MYSTNHVFVLKITQKMGSVSVWGPANAENGEDMPTKNKNPSKQH